MTPFHNPTAEAISLSRFNARIKQALGTAPGLQGQWVLAETSDVQVRRGHCYLELIEKGPDGTATVARANAVIWASTFFGLEARFRQVTGSTFGAGIKVMVRVNANFHELYGLKLVITDVNPEFTLGDMARQRREIVERLAREGLLELNGRQPWPDLPRRIAVVSARGAAGYGDFIDQLAGNAHGLKFYPCLFQALMQGSGTVSSVLDALQRIEERIDLFDCVVIIRGGGSTSDLNAFDSYELAARVARFALPVIVGIGHERDETVLDYVAALRVKTPTAAAEWLIGQGANALTHLTEQRHAIVTTVRDILSRSREQMAYIGSAIPMSAQRIVATNRLRLTHLSQSVPLIVRTRLEAERARLSHETELMRRTVATQLERHSMSLKSLADRVELLSPENTLRRGYSLVSRSGHFVADVSQLADGETVTLHMRDGTARVRVSQPEAT